MSDVTPKLRDHFEITCRTCGSDQVEVYFYPGFIDEQGGDPAYLGFRCNACGKSVDI